MAQPKLLIRVAGKVFPGKTLQILLLGTNPSLRRQPSVGAGERVGTGIANLDGAAAFVLFAAKLLGQLR